MRSMICRGGGNNVLAESIFAALKKQEVHAERFLTRQAGK
jgi:hypothetical protein